MMNHKLQITNKQNGVSLYITIVLLSLMLTSVLTLSTILTSQMKIIFSLGDAVTAFTAADAGIERALYEDRRATTTPSFSQVFSNGSRCDVTITTNGVTVIKSIGSYRGTKRAIEARY